MSPFIMRRARKISEKLVVNFLTVASESKQFLTFCLKGHVHFSPTESFLHTLCNMYLQKTKNTHLQITGWKHFDVLYLYQLGQIEYILFELFYGCAEFWQCWTSRTYVTYSIFDNSKVSISSVIRTWGKSQQVYIHLPILVIAFLLCVQTICHSVSN